MLPVAAQLVLAASASVFFVALAATIVLRFLRRDRSLGSDDAARLELLHQVAATAPVLQQGLDAERAQTAAVALQRLLGSQGVALLDSHSLLAAHGEWPEGYSPKGLGEGPGAERTKVRKVPDGARVWHVVVSPLRVGKRRVGAIEVAVLGTDASMVRAVEDTATWVSAQLGVSELESQRAVLAEAEVRALRAQISPHFIYNSLNAIASFIHTDPERARDLVLEFADFTRYSFRRQAEFTTLSEELTAIGSYLALERARFGERLHVRTEVDPEVVSMPLPLLCLQPLVENAVRHGIEPLEDGGHISITVRDAGDHALVTVEDDGVGADPEQIRSVLRGTGSGSHVGLRNVDQRLRQLYGPSAALAVDTAPGQGTAVMLHLPKFHPAAAKGLDDQIPAKAGHPKLDAVPKLGAGPKLSTGEPR
ncbi:sensor histidine kinase [Galactobacter sp.]|uniref:sensor histidine kinase n=1 Tax=Galactobacter sp. TaxID=2676125 RepID=UPI0025BB0F9F|nr:histidine kinase [Galactobacter sp.]